MSTPRDDRAAAREQRRHLQLPNPLGRAELLRSRSPSPAPVGANNAFNFPPAAPEPEQFVDARNNMATAEQLAAIRDELRNEIRAEFRNETAAAAAQIPDAIRRKPDIPAFDKHHVEI